MMMNASIANQSLVQGGLKNLGSTEAQTRRHVERLLLRLDFNGEFSAPKSTVGHASGKGVLAEGGIV